MKISKNTIFFSTGRTRYANNGIIGIGPDMNVTEGYDRGFYEFCQGSFLDEDEILTKDELIELADYMIEQWKKFRSKVVT